MISIRKNIRNLKNKILNIKKKLRNNESFEKYIDDFVLPYTFILVIYGLFIRKGYLPVKFAELGVMYIPTLIASFTTTLKLQEKDKPSNIDFILDFSIRIIPTLIYIILTRNRDIETWLILEDE